MPLFTGAVGSKWDVLCGGAPTLTASGLLLAMHGRPVFDRLAVKGLTPVRKSRRAAEALRSGTAMAYTSVVALEEIEDAARNRTVV